MAKEQFIEGKHDSGHHDGRYANVRHLAETDAEVLEFWHNLGSGLVNYIIYGDNWEAHPLPGPQLPSPPENQSIKK